jgi:hypothetical protein
MHTNKSNCHCQKCTKVFFNEKIAACELETDKIRSRKIEADLIVANRIIDNSESTSSSYCIDLTGPTGPRGPTGPSNTSCEIINSDGITIVSVCDSGIIRGNAELFELITAPGSNPFDPSNTGGEVLQYFGINPGPTGATGAFRAGSFRQSNLLEMGTFSTAFGFNTDAFGVGSLVFGDAENNSSIATSGDGSLAFGYGNTGSSITTNVNGSVAFGDAENDSFIFTESPAFGSMAFGYGNTDGEIATRAKGSVAFGAAENSSSIGTASFVDSFGSLAFGYGNTGSEIFAQANGSAAFGDAENNSSINTNGNGSVAFGYGNTDSEIVTRAKGSVAFGDAENNSSIGTASFVDAFGSLAFGYGNTGSNIFAQANGSAAFGDVENNSSIDTNGNGSVAFGDAENVGLIETGGGGIGSLAFGNCENNSSIQTAVFADAFGSMAFGYGNTGSNINTNSNGSVAFGNVENAGLIQTGSGFNSASGSMAFGFAGNTGSIFTKANGSLAFGDAENTGLIQTGGSAVGSLAGGYANNSGMIQINDNSNGSFVFGIAETTGEVHQIQATGSANFGRNNAIMPSGQPGAGGADYSFAMGNNALAYMQGSMAHSSFPGPTGYGRNQFVRVLLQATVPNSGGVYMTLGDGTFITLPYDGFAIIDTNIIGSDGSAISSTQIVFTVSRSGGSYTFQGINTGPNTFGSGNISYGITALGSDGFAIQISNTGTTTFNFCGTFNITMIV